MLGSSEFTLSCGHSAGHDPCVSALPGHSALIFAARTTLLQRSCSFLMNAAYSAGVEPWKELS